MVHALIAFLLLAVQPQPEAEPGAVPVPVEPRSEVVAEPEVVEPEEEEICRTIRIPSERVGERFRKRKVCQTREEWDEERRSRR